jgi:hypothetical protein
MTNLINMERQRRKSCGKSGVRMLRAQVKFTLLFLKGTWVWIRISHGSVICDGRLSALILEPVNVWKNYQKWVTSRGSATRSSNTTRKVYFQISGLENVIFNYFINWIHSRALGDYNCDTGMSVENVPAIVNIKTLKGRFIANKFSTWVGGIRQKRIAGLKN